MYDIYYIAIYICGRDPECMFYSGAEFTMNAYRSVAALVIVSTAVACSFLFITFMIYQLHTCQKRSRDSVLGEMVK